MSLVRPEAEVRITSLDVLSPELRAVVTDLNSYTSSDNWAVVEITNDNPRSLTTIVKYSQNVSAIMNKSQELWDIFPASIGSKRPKYTSPDTWVVGVVESSQANITKYGLFAKINGGQYGEDGYIRHALEADTLTKVNFHSLDLRKLTGRTKGEVSVILERQYLERAYVVNFHPTLIKDLKFPNRMVDFPLGGTYFFIARGEAFLSGYARLLTNYGVKTNLPTSV